MKYVFLYDGYFVVNYFSREMNDFFDSFRMDINRHETIRDFFDICCHYASDLINCTEMPFQRDFFTGAVDKTVHPHDSIMEQYTEYYIDQFIEYVEELGEEYWFNDQNKGSLRDVGYSVGTICAMTLFMLLRNAGDAIMTLPAGLSYINGTNNARLNDFKIFKVVRRSDFIGEFTVGSENEI